MGIRLYPVFDGMDVHSVYMLASLFGVTEEEVREANALIVDYRSCGMETAMDEAYERWQAVHRDALASKILHLVDEGLGKLTSADYAFIELHGGYEGEALSYGCLEGEAAAGLVAVHAFSKEDHQRQWNWDFDPSNFMCHLTKVVWY